MSKTALNLSKAKYFFDNVICNANKLPFSFVYNNEKIDSMNNNEVIKDNNTITFKHVLDNILEITYVAKYNEEFGEIEYYAYIENISNDISKEISNLISLDLNIKGNNPIVRGNHGDLVKFYEAYENRLDHGDFRVKQADGRTSHIVFPYFDLCYENEGMLIALGWAGTWEALFSKNNDYTKVIAKTCLNMNTCLLPHEKIRTALVVLLPYNGRNEDDASNLWREWFYKYNMPKNLDGSLIKPFTTCMLANDTGLKNSDGSISENYKTWKPSIDKLVKEKLVTDYRWIDAGWYMDPNKNTTIEDWWGTIGSFEVDKNKWPNDSFKEQVKYCHTLNMKTFVWFEIERVTNVEALISNYGYNKDWAYDVGSLIYNNIGNEECLNWTFNRIIKMLDDNLVDMYREDNNSVNPSLSWSSIDKKEESIYHVNRTGINENKCVLAHYKLWDMIIDYQIKNNKSSFVDACAGGGGRNDVESLRRGIPIMRSDIDRGTSSMRLSQTSTLVKWIPFHGSSTKETDYTYKLLETKGASTYVARASYLPIFNLNEAFTQNINLDYDRIRKNVNEWKDINHLLVKDYYRLTPYHHNTNKTGFTVFCYDDQDINESILLGFRMEECIENTYVAKLPYVNDNKDYEVYNVDINSKVIINGNVLKNEGIVLKFDNPKTSILLKIKQK